MVRKGRHRSHVMMRFTKIHPSSQQDWLNYSYGLQPKPPMRNLYGNAKTFEPNTPTDADYHPPLSRWRRSALSQSSSPVAPPSHSSAAKQGAAAVTSTKECGLTKTCIRYGWEGCDHLTCDYMLSYKVNDTDVDMQMSARGTGWVAVGFSSDKFMGGGDDVIVCKRERKPSSKVVSLSLGNTVKHTRPQEKKNRLTLVEGLLQDDHIYCRITRPLKFPERITDSDLDLFNDWHQLYAFGNIDGTGRILQHTEMPRVSEEKIAMVHVKDIMITTSTASLPLSAVSLTSLFLLSLTLTFSGS